MMYSHRTLGVVDLGLEVVALADHRRVQLDAGADRKAKLVVGVAGGFGQRRRAVVQSALT